MFNHPYVASTYAKLPTFTLFLTAKIEEKYLPHLIADFSDYISRNSLLKFCANKENAKNWQLPMRRAYNVFENLCDDDL